MSEILTREDAEWKCPICGRVDAHDHEAPELARLLEEIWTAREAPIIARADKAEARVAELSAAFESESLRADAERGARDESDVRVARLLALIKDAPHGRSCGCLHEKSSCYMCDCWKSRAVEEP